MYQSHKSLTPHTCHHAIQFYWSNSATKRFNQWCWTSWFNQTMGFRGKVSALSTWLGTTIALNQLHECNKRPTPLFYFTTTPPMHVTFQLTHRWNCVSRIDRVYPGHILLQGQGFQREPDNSVPGDYVSHLKGSLHTRFDSATFIQCFGLQ